MDDYGKSIEGKRRFENPKIYKESLHFQKKMKELGVAWHNTFADECTIDFCCCVGDGNYKHHLPSYGSSAKQLFNEFFDEIKNDVSQAQQEWLKKKIDSFIKHL